MGGTGQHVADDVGLGDPRRPATRDHQDGISQGERTLASTGPDGWPGGWGGAVVEMTLLIPCRQLEALETAASSLGMTMAQLIRRLLRNRLAELEGARAPEEPAFVDAEAEEGVDHGLIGVLSSQRTVGPD